MAENNNFRIAMRGYNKEDVNRFILEGDRLRREAEAELQEKIQLISQERDNLRTEIASANESLAETNKNLDAKINALVDAENKIAELTKQLDRAHDDAMQSKQTADDKIKDLENRIDESENSAILCKQELEKQTAKANELSLALTEAKEKIGELELKAQEQENALSATAPKEVGTDNSDLLIELEMLKAELAKTQMENQALENQLATSAPSTVTDDALQSRLGEVILQANRTAEQIIREANNTAKLIKMGAVEEATVIKKNFEDKMQQRAERAERLLSELSEKYFAAFESAKEELTNSVSELIAEKQVSLSEKAALMQKETEEGLLLTDAQAAALLN